MRTLVHDLRYALRILAKQPGFTATALLVLALGTGATTAVFSVVNAVLLRALLYRDPARLVTLDETEKTGGTIGVAPPNFADFRDGIAVFEQLAAYTGGSVVLTAESEAVRVESCEVSHNMFVALGVEPVLGTSFTAADEQPGAARAVVLSWNLWQKRFAADRSIIGKTIRLDGKPYAVRGVMPHGFQFPVQPDVVDLWMPLTLSADAQQMRGAHFLSVIGRLKPGASPSEAAAQATVIAGRIHQQFPRMVPGFVKVVPLQEDLVHGVRGSLWLLLGAVGFVLLIAIANISNLLLSRAVTRQREMAIRAALGGTRARLVRQLLTESVLIATIGGLIGLLASIWGTDLLLSFVPTDLPRVAEAGVDLRVFVFNTFVSLLAGIAFGIAPAVYAASPRLADSLKQGSTRTFSRGRSMFRNLLVASELALAVMLLAGAGLMIRTLMRLHAVDPGFQAGKALVAEVILPRNLYSTPERQAALFQQLLDGANAAPDIEEAGGTTNLPMSGTNMVFVFDMEGRPNTGANPISSHRSVTPEYMRAMRIPLVRGRLLDNRDGPGAPLVIVINRAMAEKYWPGEDPVGRHISFNGASRQIVGIVGDVRYRGLAEGSRPEMYSSFTQVPFPFLRLVVRPRSSPDAAVAAVRARLHELDPGLPLDKVRKLEQVVDDSISPQRFYALMLGVFSAIALALAAIGTYGVMSYVVTQRTQEIGIRMALGARQQDVLRMVMAGGMRVVAAGLAAGIAGAFAATRLIASLLFQVRPTDAVTLAVVVIVLAAAALLACYVPARRATRVDPLVALRME